MVLLRRLIIPKMNNVLIQKKNIEKTKSLSIKSELQKRAMEIDFKLYATSSRPHSRPAPLYRFPLFRGRHSVIHCFIDLILIAFDLFAKYLD